MTERMTQAEGLDELVAVLIRPRRAQFADIDSLHLRCNWTGGGVVVDRYRVRTRCGQVLDFQIEAEQNREIREDLSRSFGPRMEWSVGNGTQVLGTIMAVLGIVVTSLSAAVGSILVLLLGLALVALGWWRFVSFPMGGDWKTGGIPRDLGKKSKTRTRGPVGHSNPIRSVPLSILLKTLGVCWWLLLASPYSDPLFDLLARSPALQQVQVLLWSPAPLLVYWGYRIGRRYRAKESGDGIEGAVVFLRPFDTDGSTTLQPLGARSSITLLQPTARSGSFSWKDVAVASNPLAMVRMLCNWGATSAEESITRYFERSHRVAAIGRPGERMVTPGAERVYVDDSAWKQTVLKMLGAAPFVVVQPGGTQGVAWELEQVRAIVPPERVIFSLAASWSRPDVHERTIETVHRATGISLPRSLPFREEPYFVWFGTDWVPKVIRTCYVPRWKWPLVGDAADLERTLGPACSGVETGEGGVASGVWADEERTGSTQSWAQMGLSLLVATAVWVLPITAVTLGIGWVASIFVSPVDRHFGSDRAQLRGKEVSYALSVPRELISLPLESEGVEHRLVSRDRAFELLVYANDSPEVVDGLGEARATALREAGLGVELLSNRECTLLGHPGHEAELLVSDTAGKRLDYVISATGPKWVVFLLISHRVECEHEDALRGLRTEILDSIHLVRAR